MTLEAGADHARDHLVHLVLHLRLVTARTQVLAVIDVTDGACDRENTASDDTGRVVEQRRGMPRCGYMRE